MYIGLGGGRGKVSDHVGKSNVEGTTDGSILLYVTK